MSQSRVLSAPVFSTGQPLCVSFFTGTHATPIPLHQLILGTEEWGLRFSSFGLYPTSVRLLPLSARFSSESSCHGAGHVGKNACDKWLCTSEDSLDPRGVVGGRESLPRSGNGDAFPQSTPSCSRKPGRIVAWPSLFCPTLSNVVSSSYSNPGNSFHPRVLFQMEC